MLPLREYQERIVAGYINGEYQYLAADAGLGKSRCAIEIATRLRAKRVLVVCPASVKLAWIAELKKWAPNAKFHTPVTPKQIGDFKTQDSTPLWTIVNYDKLSRGADFLERLVENGPYSLLVLDESHCVKNLTSKRTKAVFRHLMPVCAKVLPMSATPMTRCASDLYAPLRFLKPEAVTDKHGHIQTLHHFEDRFTNVTMRRIGQRLVREVKGSRNMDELKAKMGSFFCRVDKKTCLPELPPMQIARTPIGISRDSFPDIFDALENVDLDDDNLLDTAMRDEHIMRAMKLIGVAKAASAAQYIDDYLTDNELKVVVWAKHTEAIDMLMQKLSHFNPAVIDGRVDMKGRASAVHSFLNSPDCRVFLGQVAAAGTGLTLLSETVQPRDVFAVECDWSPAINYQAYSRVHRQGMRDGVLVRVFTAQGVELDMRLQALLHQKTIEMETLI